MRVLGVVRREEAGQLAPGVLDELGQGTQPGQDDQVARIEPLAQVGGRYVRVSKKRWHVTP